MNNSDSVCNIVRNMISEGRLSTAYETLGNVVKAHPELAKEVFATFNEALKSEKNSDYSLRNAYTTLGNVVEARPELAEDKINDTPTPNNNHKQNIPISGRNER